MGRREPLIASFVANDCKEDSSYLLPKADLSFPRQWTRILFIVPILFILCVLAEFIFFPAGPLTSTADGYDNEIVSVVVVGAGISGLSAGYHLIKGAMERGIKMEVKILEARDRVGGRVHTNHSLVNGGMVELGAGWIHGTNSANPIYSFARERGIKTAFVGGDSTYIGGEHRILLFDSITNRNVLPEEREKSFKVIEEMWFQIEQKAIDLKNSGSDDKICSAIDAYLNTLNLTESERRIIEWHFEINFGGDMATDPCDLSLAYYEDFEMAFMGGDSIFPDGYQAIPEQLARDFIEAATKGDNLKSSIDLSTLVTGVKVVNDGKSIQVKADDDDRIFTADYVVMTIPLGYLQKEILTFEPALPDWKRQSIQTLKMGVLDRVVLQFEEPFWEPLDQYTFGYISAKRYQDISMIVNQYPINGNAILEFMIGGPTAINLVEGPEASADNLKRYLVDILGQVFNKEIPEPITMLYSKWGQDPYTFGAYSHIPPGGTINDRLNLGKPLTAGRLGFAGEATVASFSGATSGAFISGQREAERILNQIIHSK